MKRFLFVVAVLLGAAASAQTVDTTFIVQYRSSLDTARHMPPPERAAAYWNAARTYAAQAKWDTAAKALDKSVRLQPIDSTLRNDPSNWVTLSKIEHNRNRAIAAINYGKHAFELELFLARPTDTLIATANYMRSLYAGVNDQAAVWQLKYFADSLTWNAQNRMLVDSLTSLNNGLSNATQTNQRLESQLNTARDENKRLTNYLWMLAAAAALMLIGLVVALLTGKRTVSTTKALNASDANDVVTRSAVHVLAGLTDLMLQRGRTGDDLILLKGMERELQRLWKQTGASFPTEAVDEDRVMRQLKGIRVLVFSDNADTGFLLKNWLRKQIRLCDIQTAESFDALPTNFQPQAIVYDAQVASNETMQRLTSVFPNTPIVVSSATKSDIDASVLRKPYALSMLLERLMKSYSPSEEIKTAEPTVTVTPNAAPTIDTNAIGLNCNLLEEAYAERNGDKLIAACYGLLPLFEQANSPATKWLKLLAEPPENISEVQVELAYRNVVAYCRKATS